MSNINTTQAQEEARPDLHPERLLMQDAVAIAEQDELDTEALEVKARRMFVGVQEVRIDVDPKPAKIHGGYKTLVYRVYGRHPK